MSLITVNPNAVIVWYPTTLPDCFLQEGFSYGPVKSTVRAPMTSGLPKVRNRYRIVPWKMSGKMIVDDNQRHILDDWVKDDLRNGAKTFWKADPIIAARSWEWRLAAPTEYSPFVPGSYMVTMSMDRLPQDPGDLEGGFSLVDAVGNHLTDELSAVLGG